MYISGESKLKRRLIKDNNSARSSLSINTGINFVMKIGSDDQKAYLTQDHARHVQQQIS